MGSKLSTNGSRAYLPISPYTIRDRSATRLCATPLAQGPDGGTNTETAKQLADREGYRRVIVITDEQSHQSLSPPKRRGYVVNVAPYENGIGYGEWTHVDGWSEAVLSYVAAAESVAVVAAAEEE